MNAAAWPGEGIPGATSSFFKAPWRAFGGVGMERGRVRGEGCGPDLASRVLGPSADELLGPGRGGVHRDTASCCVEAPWAPGLQMPGGRLVSLKLQGVRHTFRRAGGCSAH